jgi:hypothetical protein
MLLLVIVTAVCVPRAAAAAPAVGPAAIITAFATTALPDPVLSSERALAMANRAVGTSCQAARWGNAVIGCADLLTAPPHSTLPALLSRQGGLLLAADAALTRLILPQLGPPLLGQLARLLEDLSLFCTQLAGLLQETAIALPVPRWPEPTIGVSYGPRVRAAVAILYRAEDWLETINQETGAHVTLPGFAPGAPSLESQLNLP